MNENSDIVEQVSQFVDKSDTDVYGMPVDEEKKVDSYVPTYAMVSVDKIPVSKHHGKIWRSRYESRIKQMEDANVIKRIDEAIRYYRNDQSERSDTGDDHEAHSMRATTRGVETENIVFANTTALVPAVYAKNPSVEMTTEIEKFAPWARANEKLVNALIRMKSAPGVNLKPKMRRGVLMASLANLAWFEVGYTKKESSAEVHIDELKEIGKKLATAKEKKDIEELEGKLMALEERIDVLQPSGPYVKFRDPRDVIIDDVDTYDEARWLMIRDHLPTAFIRAVYAQKNEKGEYDSIYEPSHVMKAGENNNSATDELNSFTMFDTEKKKNYKDYGYRDEDSFCRAQYTQVVYVWDKATRRVFLYNIKDWKYPLWVWDDPYAFPQFFPLVPLEFYTDPTEFYARGEVTYYLDQQDGINAINNEVAKIRTFAIGKALYNTNVIKNEDTVEKWLMGTSAKRVLGVDAPADADLTKLVVPFVPATAHMLQNISMNKDNLLQAIDRVSSVTSVMRGVEYKTNTTNKAIESYESNTQTRLDEKIDAVEECIGTIGEMLSHLCLSFMSPEEVAKIIGDDLAATWTETKPSVLQHATYFSLQTVGGSTLKPTSANKKQQAIQLGQVLGQFASATPAAVLVAMKVMERAFDEVLISAEEWQMLQETVQQALQANQAQAQGAPPPGGAPQEGMSQGGASAEQIEQLIDNLPPELKAALGNMLAEGTPVREAVTQVVSEMNPELNPAPMGV